MNYQTVPVASITGQFYICILRVNGSMPLWYSFRLANDFFLMSIQDAVCFFHGQNSVANLLALFVACFAARSTHRNGMRSVRVGLTGLSRKPTTRHILFDSDMEK